MTEGHPEPDRRRFLRRLMAATLVLPALAACGIKGPPQRPDTADPAYPRRYPDPETVLPRTGDREMSPLERPEDGSIRGPQGPDGGLNQDPWMGEDEPWGDRGGWRDDDRQNDWAE